MSAEPDHRRLLAAISAEERNRLLEQSDLPALNRIALHLGAIGLLSLWIASGWPGWWLALIPQGILLVFLFTAMHECTHKTAFRSDGLNQVVCWISGLILFLPPNWFRYFHLAHHRYTHDPDHDPELATPKPHDWTTYLIYLSGVPVWKNLFRAILSNAAGRNADSFVPDRASGRVRIEAQALLAFYALVAGASIWLQSMVLIWVWLVPVLLGQPFLRAFLLAEHSGCPHAASMLDNTRTTFTARLVRLISWNMPYHTEHHVYPAVPFHKLPDLHRRIQAWLVNTEPGYAAFHEKYAAGLRKSAVTRRRA
ncbi:MAG: fatty acid desaturase [Pseudomonadota bacterium]